MKKILPLLLAFAIPKTLSASFTEDLAKALFQKKVDQVYEKAINCSPLERDPKSSMDVNDWIKIQPKLPAIEKLAEIEKVAEESRKYARSIGGNDKHMHCLAGCFIAKKLDYTSAVLVGWYKELVDASDCSKKTHFEKKDYEVTIVGARGGNSPKTCDNFCKR